MWLFSFDRKGDDKMLMKCLDFGFLGRGDRFVGNSLYSFIFNQVWKNKFKFFIVLLV